MMEDFISGVVCGVGQGMGSRGWMDGQRRSPSPSHEAPAFWGAPVGGGVVRAQAIIIMRGLLRVSGSRRAFGAFSDCNSCNHRAREGERSIGGWVLDREAHPTLSIAGRLNPAQKLGRSYLGRLLADGELKAGGCRCRVVMGCYRRRVATRCGRTSWHSGRGLVGRYVIPPGANIPNTPTRSSEDPLINPPDSFVHHYPVPGWNTHQAIRMDIAFLRTSPTQSQQPSPGNQSLHIDR